MAVTYFFENRNPNYICLSSDVVGGKVPGINTIGSNVHFTDTGTDWLVKDDLTLVQIVTNLTLSGSGIQVTAASVVSVNNFPTTFSGSITNFPTTYSGSITNFPTTQITSGCITNFPTTQITSGCITNFPTIQVTSGCITNFPATQPVSGSISITTASAIITGSFVVGNTTTNAIVLGTQDLIGITTGSNLTGTSLTFLTSNDNATYLPLYDKTSTEVALTITTAARNYSLDPSTFYPWNFVKARLGTSASSVAQATVNSLIYFVTKQI